MRNLPPKILPKHFTCIGPQPDDYYFIDTNKFLRNDAPGINPKVVSSVYGKIKTLMLFYPTHKNTREESIYCYFSFLKELISEFKDGGRTFVIVTEYSDNELSIQKCNELGTIAAKNGNRLCHVKIPNEHSSLSPWVQDSFLAVEFEAKDETRERKIYLVNADKPDMTDEFNKPKKKVVAQIVDRLNEMNESTHLPSQSDKNYCNECEALSFEWTNSNIPFVGGNLLTGEDFVLIGLNQSDGQIESTGQDWFGEDKDIILLYSDETKLHKTWIKDKKLTSEEGVSNYFDSDAEYQGIFHLDVFMTLAGKNCKGQEVFVIGQPVVGFPLHKDMNPELLEMIGEMIAETTKSIDQMIELLIEKLGERPVKIVRNPLPLTYYESEEIEGKSRYWTWASYNNCLVENYNNDKGKLIKKVYLPSYGISSDYSERGTTKYGDWTELYKYDLENQWIWKKILGYDECILLKQDYNQFMSKQGALNCITNCVERHS